MYTFMSPPSPSLSPKSGFQICRGVSLSLISNFSLTMSCPVTCIKGFYLEEEPNIETCATRSRISYVSSLLKKYDPSIFYGRLSEVFLPLFKHAFFIACIEPPHLRAKNLSVVDDLSLFVIATFSLWSGELSTIPSHRARLNSPSAPDCVQCERSSLVAFVSPESL